MDEKDFKKHLSDLVHGHHHPQEHDWTGDAPAAERAPAARPRKHAARKTRRRSK